MVEIRNDFLLDGRGQVEWAERLSAALVHAAAH
jgi:predicted N-formylglutamate amidohydrolase